MSDLALDLATHLASTYNTTSAHKETRNKIFKSARMIEMTYLCVHVIKLPSSIEKSLTEIAQQKDVGQFF